MSIAEKHIQKTKMKWSGRRSKNERISAEKICDKSIAVGVIGLGYVGLPLAVEKAKAGFKTIGFDIQKARAEMVNKGQNYIGDVVAEDLQEIVNSGMLSATCDFSFIKDVDFIAICVPTPLNEYKQPDISYVESSAKEISKYLTKYDCGVGVHDVSRNHGRADLSDFGRRIRPRMRRRFLFGIFTGTCGSGQLGLQNEKHTEGCRRRWKRGNRSDCGNVPAGVGE